MTDLRACFVGDSFVAGIGDDSGLGWVGRVVADARGRGADLSPYNLGIRRDTSADIVRRAESEIAPRLSAGDRSAVVLAFGTNDLVLDLPLASTLHNAGLLIETSKAAGRTVLFVSPPPGVNPLVRARLPAVSEGLAGLCSDLETPYLDLAAVVADWSVWRDQAALGDGAHPNAEGYCLVAGAFSAWAPWRDWLMV
ncbi:MAG: GDSL-like Lipase/Acylhydrolase [Caulobacter sp.]|nr:GDSL-like Lipase/Acylhydrolase [Caulobacter sp.]